MGKKQDVKVVLSDELKEHIANTDLSGLIELIAEMLVDEWLKETTECRLRTSDSCEANRSDLPSQ